MFEAGCDIHNRAEVVERVAGSDCDARSGMKSELQHDGRRTRASASGGVEACDIVLLALRRPLTRTNWTGAPTPRNVAVSSSRSRSANAASVSTSFATAS